MNEIILTFLMGVAFEVAAWFLINEATKPLDIVLAMTLTTLAVAAFLSAAILFYGRNRHD